MEKSFAGYISLYIPFFFAILLRDLPHVSYIIAWLGSFLIFYLTFSGRLHALPADLPVLQQLLRPVFLMHIIFAGYTACTSIFYYINALGYEYFTYVGRNFTNQYTFYDIAQCQRYYCLGHAALAHAIMLKMNYPAEKKYQFTINSISTFLFQLSIICLTLSFAFVKFPFFSQFSIQLNDLSFVSGTIALAFAIKEKKNTLIGLCIILFAANLLKATISGFKEPIIIVVLLLGVFLLPIYGKKIIPIFGAILIALFILLPTFIGTFRGTAFAGGNVNEAREKGIEAILNRENLQRDLNENYWQFLTNRLSEIHMFTGYVNSTPRYIPYYRTTLVKQGIEALIPRALWAGKPVTETLVMDRVYRAGVVIEQSSVSAKPAYIVDCFLSYGYIGVWIGLFAFGYIAQIISLKAESLFGGYFLGSAVMFAGLFQVFWRGNCFEFLFNNVFWSFITMIIFFYFLKFKSILSEAE